MRSFYGRGLRPEAPPVMPWGDLRLGVALVDVGEGLAELVSVDADGVLWSLARADRSRLVRYALDQCLLVHPEFGELVRCLLDGRCVGLVPTLARLLAVPFGAVAPVL